MHSSYKKYFDPAQVESDQKDLIISQLKAELFELRRNEKNYEELHAKLNNLEHRYNLLQEEKMMNERDFKTRQEINGKTIGNLKIDIDSLRGEYESACGDIHGLRLENNGISDTITARNGELTRLRAELGDVFDENSVLDNDKRDLTQQVLKLREDNRNQTGQLEDLNNEANELADKRNKLEKYLKDLEYDRNRLEKQQIDYTKQQDQLRLDIKNKNDSIRFADQSLNDNKKHLMALESDANDLRRMNDKAKQEIQNAQRNQSNEFSKNMDAQNTANKLEDTIKHREGDIQDLKANFEAVKREHIHLLNTNDDVQHDIDQTGKHLDMLNGQNQDLINELERYNEQDERVRSMLDRKERVQDVKSKTEGKMKSSYYSMNSSLRSPQRKSRNQAD
jgi:chromosome segregation ATPase